MSLAPFKFFLKFSVELLIPPAEPQHLIVSFLCAKLQLSELFN